MILCFIENLLKLSFYQSRRFSLNFNGNDRQTRPGRKTLHNCWILPTITPLDLMITNRRQRQTAQQWQLALHSISFSKLFNNLIDIWWIILNPVNIARAIHIVKIYCKTSSVNEVWQDLDFSHNEEDFVFLVLQSSNLKDTLILSSQKWLVLLSAINDLG